MIAGLFGTPTTIASRWVGGWVHGVGRAAPNDLIRMHQSMHASGAPLRASITLFKARSTPVACLQGMQLDENPRAALAFWWEPLQRQVGGAGRAKKARLCYASLPACCSFLTHPAPFPAPLPTLKFHSFAPVCPPALSTGACGGGGGEGARGRKRCLLQQPPAGQPGGGPRVHAVGAAAARAAGAGEQGGAAGEAVCR